MKKKEDWVPLFRSSEKIQAEWDSVSGQVRARRRLDKNWFYTMAEDSVSNAHHAFSKADELIQARDHYLKPEEPSQMNFDICCDEDLRWRSRR
jgi:hypothetical protein